MGKMSTMQYAVKFYHQFQREGDEEFELGREIESRPCRSVDPDSILWRKKQYWAGSFY